LTLALLLLIILVGLVCLFAEFFIFPGLTVSGILGGICLLAGVIMGYRNFGYTTGNIIFFSTLVVSGGVFWYGVRSLSSKQFAIHEAIDSKVNVREAGLQVGDRGTAVSALRPGGTAQIGGQRLEVFTRGEFLDAGQELEIIGLSESRVVVRVPLPPKSDAQTPETGTAAAAEAPAPQAG